MPGKGGITVDIKGKGTPGRTPGLPVAWTKAKLLPGCERRVAGILIASHASYKKTGRLTKRDNGSINTNRSLACQT